MEDVEAIVRGLGRVRDILLNGRLGANVRCSVDRYSLTSRGLAVRATSGRYLMLWTDYGRAVRTYLLSQAKE